MRGQRRGKKQEEEEEEEEGEEANLRCHQVNLSALKLEDIAELLNLSFRKASNIEHLGFVVHLQGDGTDFDLLKERGFNRLGLWLVLLALRLLRGDWGLVGEVPTHKLKSVLVDVEANRKLCAVKAMIKIMKKEEKERKKKKVSE